MEKTSCKYCGCTKIDCLACCSKTGLFFCNGKGDTADSHIIHHLKTMNSNEIALPKENKYHEIPFKCYICESTDIFQLGVMVNCDGSAIYIVCRSKCSDKLCQIEENIDQNCFQPLISDGYIYQDIVSIPNSDEYKAVPFSRIISVNQEIYEELRIKSKTTNPFQSAKLQYKTRQEFVSAQLKFINAEIEETKKIDSYQYQNIHLIWKENDHFHCQFKSPSRLYQLVKNGTYLIFQKQEAKEDDQNDIETGYITKKHRNFLIDIAFDTTSLYLLTSKNEKITFRVNIKFNPIPFENQTEALQTYLNSQKCMNSLIGDIILGNLSKLDETNRLQDPIQFCEPRISLFPSFNSNQIKHMKSALSQRFSMIFGPPGSGKTSMIAALCNSLVRSEIRPILVISQTDEAVNIATMTIAKTGLNVLRFVSSMAEKFDLEVDKYLTTQIALNHFRKNSSSYSNIELLNDQEKQNIEKYELQIIRDCDVLCATCDEIGSKKLNSNQSIQFFAVIVDESCSVTDSSLLVSIVKNCQQLILLGDVNGEIQPPIRSNFAKSARFDLSLMERLMLLGLRPFLLDVQCRMKPELAEYPSKIFYGNFLKTKFNENLVNKVKNVLNWPNPLLPMFFWNIKFCEEKTVDGFSYKNDQELINISSILNSMISNGVQTKDIAVISPFIGQKKLLIEKLPELLTKFDKETVNDIEIGTVDDFKGKEKKFIIVSLVRANKKFDIDLLNNKKILCFLLTRSRCGLVIIGSAETFSMNKMWSRYIEYCKENNILVEGELNSLKSSEFQPLIELDDRIENDFKD